jgi:restriction endonuclease S subunit
MKLMEIAEISAGYPFRSRIEHDADGSCRVIQMGDINPDDTIKWQNLTRTDLESFKSAYVVREGDVLFKTRGASHTAVLVDQTEENVIASLYFFIIRVNEEYVMPEYLAWYINQPPSQQQLNRTAAGTAIRYIKRNSLAELEIMVPDLATQRKIVELSGLRRIEKQISDKIQAKREIMVNAVMLDAVKHQNVTT